MDQRNAGCVTPMINVTPLIDVLLVLLIIFMVISPMRPSRFDARIPEKPLPGQELFENDLALVVTVQREGGYRLNMLPAASLDALQASLFDALNGRPEDRKAVFLKAPRTMRYGEIVRVIDAMKAAGSAPIALQIENLD